MPVPNRASQGKSLKLGENEVEIQVFQESEIFQHFLKLRRVLFEIMELLLKKWVNIQVLFIFNFHPCTPFKVIGL